MWGGEKGREGRKFQKASICYRMAGGDLSVQSSGRSPIEARVL